MRFCKVATRMLGDAVRRYCEDSRLSGTWERQSADERRMEYKVLLKTQCPPTAVRSFEIYFARLAWKIYLLEVTSGALVLRDSRVLCRDLIGEH